ncbi:MAG: GerMN domain-containing protein [Bacillota bacterium]
MNKKTLILIVLFLLIGLYFIYYSNGVNEQPEDMGNSVKLYFSTKDAMYLKAERHEITSDLKFEETLNELIKGPDSASLNPTIPEGVKVLGLEVDKGTAFINFNRALVENHWGGSTGEIMTVYSIVNTMTQFPEISSVKILIEGEQEETLVGHIDISVPLERDEKIIKN